MPVVTPTNLTSPTSEVAPDTTVKESEPDQLYSYPKASPNRSDALALIKENQRTLDSYLGKTSSNPEPVTFKTVTQVTETKQIDKQSSYNASTLADSQSPYSKVSKNFS